MPRKIVYKFNLFTHREQVRRKKFKLENSNYYIHEQFPSEVVAGRRRLVPKLRDAKKNGKTAWVSYDTLYIDGTPVKIDWGDDENGVKSVVLYFNPKIVHIIILLLFQVYPSTCMVEWRGEYVEYEMTEQ